VRHHRDGTTETVPPDTIGAARATTATLLQRRLRGDLDTILLKALRKEPERRYASAEAFVDDIKRHLDGLPVTAQPDRVGYRVRKFVRRHRLGVATAAVFLVFVLLFGTVYTVRITEERNAALQERDKVGEVAAFLEALFDASDPFAPERLDTMQVRYFLQRGVAQVQDSLADQPLVQAQMLTVLGRVYNRLGLREEARPFLQNALDIRSRLLEPADPDVAETLIELADVLLGEGDYVRAESLSSEALGIRRAAYGPRHLGVAEALHNRAKALERLGRSEEAEALHREALAMKRGLLGDEDLEIAITLGALA
jgi:serine/threonine-protein kinase